MMRRLASRRMRFAPTSSAAAAATTSAAAGLQRRALSTPKYKGSATMKSPNVKYLVYQTRLRKPEARGFRKQLEAEEIDTQNQDYDKHYKQTTLKHTEGGFEQFPWRSYGAAIVTSFVFLVISIAEMWMLANRETTIRTLELKLKKQEKQLKIVNELSEEMTVQMAAYKNTIFALQRSNATGNANAPPAQEV
eukprot:Rhum_TRINITY_DN8159_c0_g1::Rhum_TRINITY_DN8159_c0_g1_i1::g.26487::m.26487